ncbi:MAG TPA: lysophospholipid acyltransferase family protein [Cyclobacteriaceae bacterium]|nr:lysophospholipid acyltransferase family protein [Cyclobacteriaceae bacterium]
MKPLRPILSTLYKIWVFLVFTVFMILLLPGIILPFFFGQRAGWVSYRFLALWSWIFSKLNFIRYRISGREHIVRGESVIYVSNHTSFLDIPGITLAIPGQYRPLAKKELLKIPIFGWIARSASVIVDRSNPKSRKQSMDRLKRIVNMGIPILIFAEGTQNRTSEILQPFKDGAFRMAIDTQRPIQPMVVIGAGPLMPPGTIDLKPGTIKVVIGERIPTEGLTASDVQDLKERTFSVMTDMIKAGTPKVTA